MDLARATPETFSPHLGSLFGVERPPEEVPSAGAAVELRLTDVAALPDQAGAPRREPFALEFSGPREPLLEQRIYRLRHDVLGALEVFLVPIGYDDAGGVRYQSVFN